MKKNIKIGILSFVLGAVIFSGVTGVAAYSVLANSIAYTPKNSAWQVSNVNEALDSLYLSKAGDNYSTEERVIGTWIDGKPLYQITVDLPADNSSSVIAHDYNISNVEYLGVDANGSYLYNSSINEYIPIVNNWDTGSIGYTTKIVSDTTVRISTYRKIWSQLTGKVTFRYTKTTDEPTV